jgi:hypothetical protein
MNHDKQLLKDAQGIIKAYDQNGNYNFNWEYKLTQIFMVMSEFNNKKLRVYTYDDFSFQVSVLGVPEAVFASFGSSI